MRFILLAFIGLMVQGCAQKLPASSFDFSKLSPSFLSHINPRRCAGLSLDSSAQHVSYYVRPDRQREKDLRVRASITDLSETICGARKNTFTIGFAVRVDGYLGRRGRPIDKDSALHVLPISVVFYDRNGDIALVEYATLSLYFEPYQTEAVADFDWHQTYDIPQAAKKDPFTVRIGFVQPNSQSFNLNKTPPIELITRKPRLR